jgi:putative ABC transport system permease protein
VGASCVVLGLFLNYNTINAIITEQVNQIGIMKAVGATNWQIASAYLTMILGYGLLALLIAVPLAMLSAWAMANFLLNMFNIDALPLTIDSMTLQVQIGIALLSPILAALIPITAGARITVREAISTYGLGNASTLTDRLMNRLQGIPRTLMLIIGNTFRNKKRLLLTLFTLVSSGLIFMMVISVRSSTMNTIDQDVPAMHRYQISMQFEEPERIPQIERLTLTQPGVAAVEMWSLSGGKIRLASQAEMGEDDEALTMFGMPVPTQMYGPRLLTGRWLEADDTRTIVLHQRLAEKVGVNVGDWITIYHAPKRETSWQVVGILTDPLVGNSAYVPYQPLTRKITSVNKANTIWIQTTHTDPDFTAQVALDLREQYNFFNYKLARENVFDESDTITGIVAGMREDSDIIVALLGAMTLLVAVVGSVGLNGMLSLSVLERRREIGVMRAIGATSGKISLIFIGEGLLLGLISWLIALPLSVPLGNAFTQLLASAMDRDIMSQFNVTGAILWLVIVVVLSILASWFPARGATRISVNESLAYQ